MLSNDFAAQAPWSTYDDSPNDTQLLNFSIERDLAQNGTLTFIKRAMEAGFNGTIQAYVDYPPDWMLVGDLPGMCVSWSIGTVTHSPLFICLAAHLSDNATLREDCYDVLAQYFAKYVQAYADEGPLHAQHQDT